MDTSATTRLFPALIHHIEGIIAAIATVGGGWVILRQFLYTDRIFFYIRITAVRKYSAAAHNLLEKSYKGGNGPKEL